MDTFTVTGHLLTPLRRPAADVTVTLALDEVAHDEAAGVTFTLLTDSVTTDADGHFSMAGVPRHPDALFRLSTNSGAFRPLTFRAPAADDLDLTALLARR